MTALREAALKALEAMLNFPDDISDDMFESITALKAALADPVQEPVAWRFEARHIDSAWAAAVTLKHPGAEGVYMRNVTPLYAAPPQRKAEPIEPVQEPVAWIHADPDKPRVRFLEWRENEPGYRGRWIKTPLYAGRLNRT